MDAIRAGIGAVVSGWPESLWVACCSTSLHRHVSETRFTLFGLDRFVAHDPLKKPSEISAR
jgi:hypothetical protein